MPEHERELGEISATMTAMRSGQAEIRDEFRSYRIESGESRRRQYEAIQHVQETVSGLQKGHVGLKSDLEAHVGEDNRRFGVVWRIIIGGSGVSATVFAALKYLGL